MRKTIAIAALGGLLAVTAVSTTVLAQGRAPAAPAYITAALNDSARPAADKQRDAVREPAAMLAFAGIKQGTVIAEMIPGGGYFTRIFSKAVGPTGHVYAFNNPAAAGRPAPGIVALAADANYKGNVTAVIAPLTEMKVPKPVDVVWTSQNYHDLPTAQRSVINKAAYDALKPGGTYIVLDHAAVVGTGDYAAATGKHRIDENFVKLEVLKAGFKLVGESDALRNPTDNRTQTVFEQSLNRDTDQFVLKFQKPK